jgi:hypothetical protein
MSSEYVEQYQTTGKVKHAFLSSKLHSALCGRVVIWFQPEDEQWKSDKFGLESRELCKHCKKKMS